MLTKEQAVHHISASQQQATSQPIIQEKSKLTTWSLLPTSFSLHLRCLAHPVARKERAQLMGLPLAVAIRRDRKTLLVRISPPVLNRAAAANSKDEDGFNRLWGVSRRGNKARGYHGGKFDAKRDA